MYGKPWNMKVGTRILARMALSIALTLSCAPVPAFAEAADVGELKSPEAGVLMLQDDNASGVSVVELQNDGGEEPAEHGSEGAEAMATDDVTLPDDGELELQQETEFEELETPVADDEEYGEDVSSEDADDMEVEALVSGYDTADTARSISVNTTYSACLNSGADCDWYRFATSSAGYVSLSFGREYSTEGAGWRVYLYSSDKSTAIGSWLFQEDSSATEQTFKVGLAAGTYYVQVKSASQYSLTRSTYSLRVNHTASGVWEREPSNDLPGAQPAMSVGTTYYGTIRKDLDEDWWSFATSSAGYVSLSFGREYSTEGAGWRVYLYSSDKSTAIGSWLFQEDSSATEHTSNIRLVAGTYYVQVKPASQYSLTRSTYSLRVNRLTSITSATVTGISRKTYTGRAQTQSPVVRLNGTTLRLNTDYTLSYKNNTKAGTATVTINGKGNYCGSVSKNFTIVKAANPLIVKAVKRAASFATLKERAVTVARPMTVSKAQGKVTFIKASGSTRLTVNKTTGRVTVKKGTKKGTYTIKIKVTASGNANYKSGSRTVTCRVVVK